MCYHYGCSVGVLEHRGQDQLGSCNPHQKDDGEVMVVSTRDDADGCKPRWTQETKQNIQSHILVPLLKLQ